MASCAILQYASAASSGPVAPPRRGRAVQQPRQDHFGHRLHPQAQRDLQDHRRCAWSTPPGRAASARAASTAAAPLPPYGPDKLDNYEIGWKTQFGDVTFNGAIYQEDWNNIQLSFLGANGLTEVRNAGIARIRGIEADLTYHRGRADPQVERQLQRRRDHARISANDRQCATSIAHRRPGNLPPLLAPAGTQLPVTPKFKGSALARYEFPLGMWDGHVQLAVSHTGKRRNDLRTAENAFLGNLPAYTTADVSLGIDTGELPGGTVRHQPVRLARA